MGKRSTFQRRERDCYDTPRSAVLPLLTHLPRTFTFAEPCAGAGQLIRLLEAAGGTCVAAFDIAPRAPDIPEADALELELDDLRGCDLIVTNPPWSRPVLHRLIAHLSALRPAWLLIDANWLHTRQAAPLLPRLRTIVTIGRVKWISHSPFTGKDDAAWLLFGAPSSEAPRFYGVNPQKESNAMSTTDDPPNDLEFPKFLKKAKPDNGSDPPDDRVPPEPSPNDRAPPEPSPIAKPGDKFKTKQGAANDSAPEQSPPEVKKTKPGNESDPPPEPSPIAKPDVPKKTKPNGSDPAPDPFDPAALRIDPDGEPGSGVKKLLPQVPVRKPHKHEFFRCHPDPTYRLRMAVLELGMDKEVYACTPAIAAIGNGGHEAGGDARLPVACRRRVPVARPVAGRRRTAQRLARDRARRCRAVPRPSGPACRHTWAWDTTTSTWLRRKVLTRSGPSCLSASSCGSPSARASSSTRSIIRS